MNNKSIDELQSIYRFTLLILGHLGEIESAAQRLQDDFQRVATSAEKELKEKNADINYED